MRKTLVNWRKFRGGPRRQSGAGAHMSEGSRLVQSAEQIVSRVVRAAFSSTYKEVIKKMEPGFSQ